MESTPKKRVHRIKSMVRPLVQHLYESFKKGVWPEGPAAVTDFGIDSREHFEALCIPVRKGEISADDLDRALGNGPLLTMLVRQAPSNPHKSIEFKTPYDNVPRSKRR
jgi:hypothetical protein